MSDISAPDHRRDRSLWGGILVLFLLTLLTFGDLFFGGPMVLSKAGADLYLQDYHWRSFGFGQLRQGHFPLWNPHIFAGTPFFGTFQSALLYPLNLHYLFMPLTDAINFGIALHVFLAGVFMLLWARYRGLHPAACVLAGALFMFCGPHFLHIYAGHLGRLCAITWVPLVFLAVDGWYDRRAPGWVLLGAAAVAMQIIGGDPQYVFYTGVAAVVYAGLCLWSAPKRWSAALGFAAMYAGALALGAVQVLAGLDALRGTIRGDSLPYDFATKFSFPPENLLTLLTPGFFGNLTHFAYWGRCYLWEVSIFFSVTGMVLALYGGIRAPEKARRFAVTMTVILFVLALGVHTPLFPLLYHFAPGFNKFRGISKFALPMMPFLILLAAMGMDLLLRREGDLRRLSLIVVAAAVAVLGFAVLVRQSAMKAPEGLWQRALSLIPPLRNGVFDPTAEAVYFPFSEYSNPAFARAAGTVTFWMLLISAATLLVLALLLALAKRTPRFRHAVAGLAILEIFVFALASRATFDPAELNLSAVERFVASHPGDYRVLNFISPDMAMTLGTYDAWGYAPLLSGRYAQFMAVTQGLDPAQASQYLNFRGDHPLLDLTRCRYFVGAEGQGLVFADRPGRPLPRLQLVSRYRVIPDRDRALAAMNEAAFDPREEVILEEKPVPEPKAAESSGKARIIQQTTDSLTIEASLPQSAILLVTDTWYDGWRVVPLDGAPANSYRVMPADYAFRAIPLSAGEHKFRLEYSPFAFRLGLAFSILALTVFAAVGAWAFVKNRFFSFPPPTCCG